MENTTKIKVLNNTNGVVCYRTETGIKRRWDTPSASKDIEFLELQQLIGQSGGYELLKNALLVRDQKARELLGLPGGPFATVAIEQIAAMFETPSKLEDLLENCNDFVKKNVVSLASKTRINNMTAIQVIKAYTGCDLISVYKNMDSETPVATEKKATKRITKSDAEDVPERKVKRITEKV